MWKYEFSKESIKILDKLDVKTSDLINRKIKNIASWLDNTDNLAVDIKKLKGKWEGFYRLRIRGMRVILTIDYENKIIRIHDIESRRDIYK